MSGVCFVDTETTGLDPDLHQIWEVGLILPDGSEYDWQLPVDLGRADPMALKISRFHERRYDPEELTPIAAFAESFAELTRGFHLAGAVISFDEERLRRLLRANGQCHMWHYHLIDVEALAAGWLIGTFAAIQEVGKNPEADGPTKEEAMRALPPWDSHALSEAIGVVEEEEDVHTALGDARWARSIYRRIFGDPE